MKELKLIVDKDEESVHIDNVNLEDYVVIRWTEDNGPSPLVMLKFNNRIDFKYAFIEWDGEKVWLRDTIKDCILTALAAEEKIIILTKENKNGE